MRSIRSLVLSSASWNPASDHRDVIRYLDVSAVSSETMAIDPPVPIMARDAPSRARKIVQQDDTIFATIRPALKRVAKVPPELDNAIASTAFCILRPDKSQIDPDYLFFLASSDEFVASVAGRQTGASYPAVRDRDVLDQEVEIPTLEKQKEISKALNAVRRSFLHELDLLDVAEKLKRATMAHLFTRGLRGEAQKDSAIGPVPESWEVVNFGKAREWLQYGTSVHCTTEKQRHPVLRIPNVESGRVNAADLKYCNLSDSEASKYALQAGDLLFIRTNGVLERLGSCAVYDGDPAGALFASYLIRARLKPCADSRFVSYFYASQVGTSQIAGRATPASDGKYNLNTGIIDSLPLPLPPTPEEQREIVAIVDALDRKISLHGKKKAVLEELFHSLLHELMTGEVRVGDLDLSSLQASNAENTWEVS